MEIATEVLCVGYCCLDWCLLECVLCDMHISDLSDPAVSSSTRKVEAAVSSKLFVIHKTS
jgi:hypothetical protein